MRAGYLWDCSLPAVFHNEMSLPLKIKQSSISVVGVESDHDIFTVIQHMEMPNGFFFCEIHSGLSFSQNNTNARDTKSLHIYSTSHLSSSGSYTGISKSTPRAFGLVSLSEKYLRECCSSSEITTRWPF